MLILATILRSETRQLNWEQSDEVNGGGAVGERARAGTKTTGEI